MNRVLIMSIARFFHILAKYETALEALKAVKLINSAIVELISEFRRQRAALAGGNYDSASRRLS